MYKKWINKYPTCIKLWHQDWKLSNHPTTHFKKFPWGSETKVISQTQNNWNKSQGQFMKTTRKIQYHTFHRKKTQQHWMGFIISLINKSTHAIKVKNSISMDEKARAQEHTYQLISFISLLQKKHHSFLFPKMTEDYLPRNSRVFQAQAIMNQRDRLSELGIKFRHLLCQERPEMFHSLSMELNIHLWSRKVFID